MKKSILLFTAIAGMGYVILTSEAGGPALSGNFRTGAKGTSTTCGAAGCHGTGTGPTVTITVDSGTTLTPVTHYKPGMAYTIKIHGAGSTNPKFGFQFASVSGTGTSQVQAGTASGLPTNVAIHTPSTLSFVEQTATLTGTSAGVYDVSFTWTAPTPAVGPITLYCTLNAVNGNASEDNADVSGNTSVTLAPVVSTSVPNVTGNIGVTAFPNPVVNTLNLQLDNAGNYAVEVFNLNGKVIARENITVSGGNQAAINTSNWAKGTYMVSVAKDGDRKVIAVVK